MTAGGGRILVSTFGSAGDLFPLVPVIEQLRSDGHEIVVAAPRSIGLYLRSIGLASLALGDGREMGVFGDDRMFSNRFDGWESWYRTVNDYVRPGLRDDVDRIEAHVRSWEPDVVVAGSFAVAARVAAARTGVPLVDLSIYPQHQDRRWERVFPRGLGADLDSLVAPNVPVERARLAWGAPADVLLHDPALLGREVRGSAVVGFPYWDGAPARPDDREALDAWIAGPSAGDRLLVTLGSFVGSARREAWLDVAAALPALGVRAVFVGARSRWADEVFADRPDILTAGFVPLSAYLGSFDGVVHHGGIGTTFAVLRSSRPAVVLPQAFDQAFNADLVADAGAGLTGGERLADAIAAVLGDVGYRGRAAALAAALIPSGQAAASAAACVADAIGSGGPQ